MAPLPTYDDENCGVLVVDEPVIVHCDTTPGEIEEWWREARQGEIELVIGDEYFAIRNFTEE